MYFVCLQCHEVSQIILWSMCHECCEGSLHINLLLLKGGYGRQRDGWVGNLVVVQLIKDAIIY